MESIIKKTGLGIAVMSAIAQEGLQANQNSLMHLFNEVFLQKFEEFKKIHNHNFPSITVKGNYLIDNQFPIGQNDKQQYFRCLCYDVRIGNNSLAFDVNEEKRKFTVIEGYSRNDERGKRGFSKSNSKNKYPKSKSEGRKKKQKFS